MKKLKAIGFLILVVIPFYIIVIHHYPNRSVESFSTGYRFGYEHYEEILWYLHRDYPRIWKLAAYLLPEIKELSY